MILFFVVLSTQYQKSFLHFVIIFFYFITFMRKRQVLIAKLTKNIVELNFFANIN